MATDYPGAIDTLTDTFTDTVAQTSVHPGHHNDLADSVMAIETELGTDPSGGDATVKARIAGVETDLADHISDAVDAHAASAISITDSGGYYTSTNVEGALQEVGAGGGGGGGGGGASVVFNYLNLR